MKVLSKIISGILIAGLSALIAYAAGANEAVAAVAPAIAPSSK